MARSSSIMRRWMLNSISVVFVLLFIFGAALMLSIRSYYYKSVEYSLSSRIEAFESVFSQMFKSDARALSFDSFARRLVESFEDKEKLEMQVLNPKGEIVVSSTGFESEMDSSDYQSALTSKNGRGVWTGRNKAGERVMSMTLALRGSDRAAIGGIRYVTSLTLVDRQIWMFFGIMVLISIAIMFFMLVINLYFVSTIVEPVTEINSAARRIALGDYDFRINKKTDDEIGELCDTINFMAEEISAGEKMKNDFISSVSHELRTPLTAIKGWTETMLQAGWSDVELNEKGLEVISGEVERLSGIVEDLLDFSRMQGGHLALKFTRMDISAELGEAVVLFKNRAARENIELIYIEPENLPPVLGDSDRLKQVFVNVLDNAIKYSNPGGKIRVETANMGEHVQIVISDTGVGISKEDLPNIKKKFYKANRSRPGSGIGLALADEIIRRHKGRLEIDSEENVGTTVTITLPAAPSGNQNPQKG